ncbi:MAG: DUF2330 domain-containing protein [Nannocystaceae bacterium]
MSKQAWNQNTPLPSPSPRAAALATSLLAAGLCLSPGVSRACGGTFCDGVMPVNQTGENILFVMDAGRTEAHIQIQYDPESGAEKFAWLIPISAVPEFSVGSDALFQNLLNASVPAYGFTTTFEECAEDSPNSAGVDAVGNVAPEGGKDGGPEVLAEVTVGAFDVVVLSGGTAEEVLTWLQTEGYDQDPDAAPILAEYLAEGFMFAAFKLNNSANVSEIHPVVLSFEIAEACVPLRLTRIAAQENMEVRTFFLSDHRVVPRNYRHVQVNPLKIDWLDRASNYRDVVTRAVDEDRADGRAFVTEYAGTSEIVQPSGLVQPTWDASIFATIDPIQVSAELQRQDFLYCEPNFGCEYYHSLILGILGKYLPTPEGVEQNEFYACLECFEEDIDLEAWDSAGFAETLQERIVDPGRHATQLLERWPYLTRMYTTISPAEMTEDPLFYENADLPDVPNIRQGQRRFLCSGDTLFTLPGGREVFIPADEGWPEFPDAMPWAEEVDAMLPAGQPRNLVNNTARIDALLTDYNAARNWPRGGCSCRSSSAGATISILMLFGLFAVVRRRPGHG